MPPKWKAIIVFCGMIIAAGLGQWMNATSLQAASQNIDLEHMVPLQFAGWRIDASIAPVQISPDTQARLDRIYSQTLARTYINDQGERVMLSIAYGGQQSDALQAHYPEVCYAAQGFAVTEPRKGQLASGRQAIPVHRLIATQGLRHEPITYWIVTGGEITESKWQRKMQQMRFRLQGGYPDGWLIRVSTIDRNDQAAFRLQADFVASMLSAMQSRNRQLWTGERML